MVTALGLGAFSSVFDCELNDGAGVPAVGNGDIEMKMGVLIVA